MDASRPIVGISEGFADYGDYYGFGYGRPLLAAGALPVLLPYYEREADRIELLQRVDALVLAGGRDIEPHRYGRAIPHASPGREVLPSSMRSSSPTRVSRSMEVSRCSGSAAGVRS